MVLLRSKYGLWVGTITVIFGLFLMVKWFQWACDRRFDLGNKPPSQVFQRVFLRPVPAGVSDIKVAGMSSLSGVVWMRFQVKDVHAFLGVMKSNPLMSVTRASDPGDPEDVPSHAEVDRDPYSSKVDWNATYRIGHPEFYSYESVPQGHGWFGAMIVDRQQKTIFVHGGLM